MDERQRDRTTKNVDGKQKSDVPHTEPVRLDLDRLDLTVDEVEERIRPGETNVFDK